MIPYYALSDEMFAVIARLRFGRIAKRIEEIQKVSATYDEPVVKLIAERCTEFEGGGRMIDAILTNTVLSRTGGELLTGMIEGKPVARVHAGVDTGAFSYDFN